MVISVVIGGENRGSKCVCCKDRYHNSQILLSKGIKQLLGHNCFQPTSPTSIELWISVKPLQLSLLSWQSTIITWYNIAPCLANYKYLSRKHGLPIPAICGYSHGQFNPTDTGPLNLQQQVQQVQQILLQCLDSGVQPLDHTDWQEQKEVASTNKLVKGDGY